MVRPAMLAAAIAATAVLTACSLSPGATGEASAEGSPTEAVRQTFGLTITLPQGMDKWKAGHDFIWLSDDGNAAMSNICIYALPGLSADSSLVATRRDSVMQRNIPGQADGMYMHTEAAVRLVHRSMNFRGRRLLRSEGLWELEGDAMGGPFVCHTWVDTAAGRTLVAEAFVYAPGQDKAPLMKRLEAALLTIRQQ